MANNRIQIKRTSVSGRAANTTTLTNAGELALNMTDGIMYSTNGSVVFEIGANTTNSRVTNNLTVGGTVTATGIVSGSELTSTNASGDEGGQINLTKPPNGTLDGGITIDAYQNKIRIFEQGGSARGVYINLPDAAGGVGTNLLATGGSGSVNTSAQYTWTNTQIFQANVAFTGNNISVVSNTGSVMFGGAGDTNWRIGRSTGSFNKSFYTNNTLDFIAANSNLEGIAFGFTGNSVYLETGYAGTFTINPIYVGNSSVNVSINSTSFSGTSNNSTNLGGTAAANFVQNTDSRTLSGNLNFTGANLTVTANLTIASTGELIITSGAGIYANGTLGTANQVLTTNGTTVYWADVSGGGGGFTNGQSISVNNFVLTGSFTANSSTGSAGQFLLSSNTSAYWSNVSILSVYYANGSVAFEATGIVSQVGGALGAGGDEIFYENDIAITADYTIGTNKNAMTAGPVTINSGITVTVPSGSVWTIV